MHQRLRERNVTVIVSARAAGRKAAASWTFHYDPSATPTPAPAATPAVAAPFAPAAQPATDEAGLPPMKPAE
jgi:hypothetical protein